MRQDEASMTARRVARQRLGFARLKCPSATAAGAAEDDLLQGDVAAGLEPDLSRLTRYLAARTRFFDQAVVDALSSGTTQVVVAGAGYDGRSLRYRVPGVRWFELDHSSTQTDKLARLERLGISTAGIAFGGIDFGAGGIAGLLADLGHDRTRDALYYCEGVAIYLPRGVLASLLSALAATAAAGSSLVVEVPLDPTSPAQLARRERLHATVASLGEPLHPALPRQELEGFLASAGWTVLSATAPDGGTLDASDSAVAFVVAGR